MKVAIVGAGIAGRLCAWSLQKAGHQVSVFEKNARHSEGACSFVAAGLLTPMAEAANGDAAIAKLGSAGLNFWKAIADEVGNQLVQLNGSVSLTFKSDEIEFIDFEKKLAAKGVRFRAHLDKASGEEPDLEQDKLRYHIIDNEGAVDTCAFLKYLLSRLEESGVSFQFSTPVVNLASGIIQTPTNELQFDHVVDCRGFSAGIDLADLRGVRGEVIHLRAPEVNISRPVRVLHPRNPVYIVPRPDHEYVIGATSIESDDCGPITVKSTLDLLNGVYNLHHGFRYASVIKTASGCRPAFTNNLPRIEIGDRLTRVNGLFRHGFLLGPLVAETVGHILSKTTIHPEMRAYVQEIT